MPAKIVSSIAGTPARGAGDLDEQVRAGGLGVEPGGVADRAGSVVGEERADLDRDEAVHAVGPVVHRAEQVGRLREIVERQLEERALGVVAGSGQLRDRGVVRGGTADRLLVDRGVGGEAGHVELGDVPGEGPAGEHVAGDVVEPDALPGSAQLRGPVHRPSSPLCSGASPRDHETADS